MSLLLFLLWSSYCFSCNEKKINKWKLIFVSQMVDFCFNSFLFSIVSVFLWSWTISKFIRSHEQRIVLTIFIQENNFHYTKWLFEPNEWQEWLFILCFTNSSLIVISILHLLIKCANTKQNRCLHVKILCSLGFHLSTLSFFITFFWHFTMSIVIEFHFLRITVHGKRYGVMDKIKFYWFSFCIIFVLGSFESEIAN